jgi:NitT/TauT family transport system substrate-binding protein
VRVAYPAALAIHLPLAVAHRAGYYAAEGLDVDLQFISGIPTIVAALVAGEVDAASITPTPAIAAALEGADVMVIAYPITRFAVSFYSQPGIRSAEALRGGRVGIVGPGSASETSARHALRHFQLDPAHDISFIRTGGVAQTLAALIAGAVDAGVLAPPLTLQARQAGLHELLDLSQLNVEYPSASLVVHRRMLTARESDAVRLLRALGRAVYRLKTDQAFALESLREFSGVADESHLAEAYHLTAPLLREPPTPTRAGTAALLEELAHSRPDARHADPTRFYEPRLVQRLAAEGFYDQLSAQHCRDTEA